MDSLAIGRFESGRIDPECYPTRNGLNGKVFVVRE